METGLLGFKGHIHFRFAKPINDCLDEYCAGCDKQETVLRIASLIDKEIHYNYEIYPVNYIAYDLVNNSGRFEEKYSIDDREKFIRYVDEQIDRIRMENKDYDFLRKKIYEMYSNILKNYLAAHNA
jgi:hypothetical protein